MIAAIFIPIKLLYILTKILLIVLAILIKTG
jgi:hypothetical protein